MFLFAFYYHTVALKANFKLSQVWSLFVCAIVTRWFWPTTQKDTISFKIIREMSKKKYHPNSDLSWSNKIQFTAVHTGSKPPNCSMVTTCAFSLICIASGTENFSKQIFHAFFPLEHSNRCHSSELWGSDNYNARPLGGERSERKDKLKYWIIVWKTFIVFDFLIRGEKLRC